MGVRQARGYTVVSKDSDFGQLAFLYGQPPKVIWLRVGNQPTRPIAELLRASVDVIAHFGSNIDEAPKSYRLDLVSSTALSRRPNLADDRATS